MSETQMLSVKKIKITEILKNSLKHNHRQIPRELGGNRHIDPNRCSLNQVLVGGSDPAQIVCDTEAKILHETGKPLRKNGVLAIEYVVSLRSGTKVDTNAYFPAVVEWLEEYLGCHIISAVVHLDEANPHMHVLVLPLRNGRMMGSELVGYKGDLAALKQSHYKCVGQRFGLQMAESIPRYKRYELSKQVVDTICASKDLLDQPMIRSALVNVIQINPNELMAILGIKLTFEQPATTKP
jgi:Plasmid recombination enzyme